MERTRMKTKGNDFYSNRRYKKDIQNKVIKCNRLSYPYWLANLSYKHTWKMKQISTFCSDTDNDVHFVIANQREYV